MDRSLERELRQIFEASPEKSYSLSELKTQLRDGKHVEVDDLRAELWGLFYKAFARPFSGDQRELRWKLMERQTTNLNPTPRIVSQKKKPTRRTTA